MIGALDYATANSWFDLYEQTVRREQVIHLMDRIAQQAQGMPLTLVVLDNASMHHEIDRDKLDDWLMNHRLVLLYLPPYSPELNPIEIV